MIYAVSKRDIARTFNRIRLPLRPPVIAKCV
jgi:hypothetical protein